MAKNKGKEKEKAEAVNGEQPPAQKKWTFDDTNASYHKAGLLPSEEKKYKTFKNHVSSGMNPYDAAAAAGVKDYKHFGDTNQVQGRLGGKQRFTGFHEEATDPETGETHPHLRIHQIGGHTK